MSADRLYTPQLLGAAVELTQWPPLENAALRGTAKSSSCGSTLALDLLLDSEGRIAQIGLRVRACAIGQAAAAVFARHAEGLNGAEIGAACEQVQAWLADAATAPDWPDFELIAPAKSFPGRHGAMALPWNAAIAALSSVPAAR